MNVNIFSQCHTDAVMLIILQQVASMTAATEPSAAMDCAIVTPDKQGGESMWQHHKQSTDENGFTDGGHSS